MGHAIRYELFAEAQPAAPGQAAFAFSDTLMPQYQIKTTRIMISLLLTCAALVGGLTLYALSQTFG